MATKPATKTAAKTEAKPAAKSTSTAVARAKVNLPANINEAMAAEIASLQKRLGAPSGDRITVTQGGEIKLPNGLTVDSIECVIVDFVAANYYYDQMFDRNNIVPPKCFAIGLEPAGLVPSASSPEVQCEACAGCWANQFKSARNGKGKACSNTRLLAILPLTNDDGSPTDENTPLRVIKASATAVRFFDGYVGSVVSKYGVPIRGVTTRITLSDDEYPSLRFEVMEKLNVKDSLLAVAYAQKEAAMTRLMTEPDVSQAANDDKPAARRAAPAKKVANARR